VKVIEVSRAGPSPEEMFTLARQGVVVLRQPDGSVFALAQVDDFDVEAEQLRGNAEFMALLSRFSEEEATISIEELRKGLAI
jgi:hypothetical protein